MEEEGKWKDIGIAESLAIGYDPEQIVYHIEFSSKFSYIVTEPLRFGRAEYSQKNLR
jgi:hypothetical protein